MPLQDFGLRERPFNESGEPLTFVNSRSQQDAFRFLENSLTDERGIAHIYGPEMSGKTTLVRRFGEEHRNRMSVAYINGEGLYASQLLSKVLELYGYEVALSSTDELLNMLQVFVVQQTQTTQPPLLIVDNMHRMFPGALNALCRLADMTARNRYALRIVLVSQGDCRRILNSPSMTAVSNRLSGSFELLPLSAKDASRYLYAKLKAAGASQPDDIFSVTICDRLFELAGGLPGRLDKLAADYIENGETEEDAPRFIVTCDNRTLMDVNMVATRVLIGRSDFSDILLTDRFISSQHALIMWEDDAVILVDLNSSNGTYVNSRRIKTQILRNNDVIQLGDHRIKMIYPKAGVRTDFEDVDLADTAKMKNIADARRVKAMSAVTLRAVR